ncbi:hypothetical protein AWB68_00686 [Caballeronia choica]|uniref:Uncharacterized protein n=2 Tax=Caballeronia choica TaxID=326476 RepID=A0A158FIZ2_9BURK|nr:hypothetical protein AWB68_00686 [Caballeronia choica]
MEGQQEVVAAILSLQADLNQRHSENVTRHDVTDKKVEEAIRRIDDLHKAFPGGDWDGHRRYHEAVIQKIAARGRPYQDLQAELAKKGLWAFIVGLAAAVWYYTKAKVIS